MFSIKAGPSVSNFYGTDNPDDTKIRLAFSGGINTQFIITDQFSLMYETNFLPMGMRVKDGNNKYILRNRYVQFALKPRWYINEKSIWDNIPGFFIDAGVYTSYLFSSRASGNLYGIEYAQVDMINHYESWDYGISFGGGVSGLRIFYIMFNYNIGLAEISNNLNIKNNSWDISFMFFLGGTYRSDGKLKWDSFLHYLF